MNTTNAFLTVRGLEIDVIYKDIKNLHIGVYPPFGRVRVAAPTRLNEEQIRLAVIRRLPSIKRRRDQLRDAPRQSQRELVTGESHYVWGTRHRLTVVERPGRAQVELHRDRVVMYVPEGTESRQRQKLLNEWYRAELRRTMPGLLARWEPILGRRVASWTVRRMKTKWGSCNPGLSRLWVNLELAKKHPLCLEYVLVHEMAHLLERGHGLRFVILMDRLMPDWRGRRDQLNGAPLAAEDWPELLSRDDSIGNELASGSLEVS